MQLFKSKERRERFQTVGHIIVGIVVLLHAVEEFDKHQSAFGLIYLAFGIAFVILALVHRKLEHRFPDISSFFFFIEGMVLLVTGFKYIHEHKQYLQYAYFLSGIAYVVLGFLFSQKEIRKEEGLI